MFHLNQTIVEQIANTMAVHNLIPASQHNTYVRRCYNSFHVEKASVRLHWRLAVRVWKLCLFIHIGLSYFAGVATAQTDTHNTSNIPAASESVHPNLAGYIGRLRAMFGSNSVREMDLFAPEEDVPSSPAWPGESQFMENFNWPALNSSEKGEGLPPRAKLPSGLIDLGQIDSHHRQQHSGMGNFEQTIQGSRAQIETPALSQSSGHSGKIAVLENGPVVAEFNVNGIQVSKSVDAQLQDGLLWMPLKNFVRLMDFPITFSADGKRGRGSYRPRGEMFTFDLGTGYVVNGMRRVEIDPAYVQELQGDVWIALPALADWFGVAAGFDVSSQSILVRAPEDFPSIPRLQQQSGITLPHDNSSRYGHHAQGARVFRPRAMTGPPIVGLNLGTGYQRDSDQANGEQGNSAWLTTYSLQGAADLLGSTARIGMTGDTQDILRGGRFHLTWRDEISHLGKQQALTHFQVGDIVTVPQGFVASSHIELGIRANNALRSGSAARRDARIFGRAYPGWDVELYRGGSLLGFQSVGEGGEYTFNTDFIYSGANHFRLVFRSPEGEVYERRHVIPYRPHGLARDAFTYDVTLSLKDRRLIPTSEEDNSTENDATTVELDTHAADKGTARLSGDFRFGLSDTASTGFGIHSHVREMSRHTHLSSNFRFEADEFSAEVGGTAYLPETKAENDGSSLEVMTEFSYPNRHFSVGFILSDHMKTATGVSLPDWRVSSAQYVALALLSTTRLDLHSRFEIDRYESGKNVQTWSPSVSFPIGAGYVIQKFDINRTQNATQAPISAESSEDGVFLEGVSSYYVPIFGGSGRLRARYDLEPTQILNEASGFYSRQYSSGDSVGVNIKRNFKDNITEVGFNSLYNLDYARFGPSITVKSDGSFGMFLNLRSLIDTGDRGRIQLRAPTIADSGALSVRVYLDENRNQSLDAGEKLIQGAKVQAVQGGRGAISDRFGVAYIHSIPDGILTDVVVDKTLLNPLLRVPPARSVVVRSGRTLYLDIPLTHVSEIRGSLFYEDPLAESGDIIPELTGVGVILTDRFGVALQRVRAQPGGAFAFNNLAPGTYFVTVDADSAANRELHVPRAREVHIESSPNTYSLPPILVRKLRSNLDADLAINIDAPLPREITDITVLTNKSHADQVRDQDGFRVAETSRTVTALQDTANDKRTKSMYISVNLGTYATKWTRALAWRLLKEKWPDLTGKVRFIPISPENVTNKLKRPWPLVVGVFQDTLQAEIFCEHLERRGHKVCTLYPVEAGQVGQF